MQEGSLDPMQGMQGMQEKHSMQWSEQQGVGGHNAVAVERIIATIVIKGNTSFISETWKARKKRGKETVADAGRVDILKKKGRVNYLV